MPSRLRRLRFGSIVVLMCVVAAGCSDKKGQENAPPPVAQQASPAAAAPVAAPARTLTLDGLPQGARAALTAQAPDFTPWSANSYAPSARTALHTSTDEGLSVVRGHFRSPSTVDYVVAGFDRKKHTLRIVAILTQPAGAFKVMNVAQGPERGDSLATRASRYLVVDNVTGTADVLVKPIPGGFGEEHYTWVPGRGRFQLVEGS